MIAVTSQFLHLILHWYIRYKYIFLHLILHWYIRYKYMFLHLILHWYIRYKFIYLLSSGLNSLYTLGFVHLQHLCFSTNAQLEVLEFHCFSVPCHSNLIQPLLSLFGGHRVTSQLYFCPTIESLAISNLELCSIPVDSSNDHFGDFTLFMHSMIR